MAEYDRATHEARMARAHHYAIWQTVERGIKVGGRGGVEEDVSSKVRGVDGLKTSQRRERSVFCVRFGSRLNAQETGRNSRIFWICKSKCCEVKKERKTEVLCGPRGMLKFPVFLSAQCTVIVKCMLGCPFGQWHRLLFNTALRTSCCSPEVDRTTCYRLGTTLKGTRSLVPGGVGVMGETERQ